MGCTPSLGTYQNQIHALPLCTSQIFDGPNVHALPLGAFCGLSLPDPVRSTGSAMTLEFKSDNVIGGRGFLIEWTAVQSTGPIPTIAPGRGIMKLYFKSEDVFLTHGY